MLHVGQCTITWLHCPTVPLWDSHLTSGRSHLLSAKDRPCPTHGCTCAFCALLCLLHMLSVLPSYPVIPNLFPQDMCMCTYGKNNKTFSGGEHVRSVRLKWVKLLIKIHPYYGRYSFPKQIIVSQIFSVLVPIIQDSCPNLWCFSVVYHYFLGRRHL